MSPLSFMGVMGVLMGCLAATIGQYYPGGGGMGCVDAMGAASAGHGTAVAMGTGGFAGGPAPVGCSLGAPGYPSSYPIGYPSGYPMGYSSGYPAGYSSGYQAAYPNYHTYPSFAAGAAGVAGAAGAAGAAGGGVPSEPQASENVNENTNTNVNMNGGSFRRSLRGPVLEQSNANVNSNSNANSLR